MCMEYFMFIFILELGVQTAQNYPRILFRVFHYLRQNNPKEQSMSGGSTMTEVMYDFNLKCATVTNPTLSLNYYSPPACTT